MKRIISLLASALCLAVYLPFGLLFTAPLAVDFDAFKAPLSALVRDELGLGLEIRGDISLLTLFRPGIRMRDVHFVADKDSAWIVDDLSARIDPLALLGGDFRLAQVTLRTTRFDIVPFVDGMDPEDGGDSDGQGDDPPDLSFLEGTVLTITDGDILYDDGDSAYSWTGSSLRLTATAPQGWVISGVVEADTMAALDRDGPSFPLSVRGDLSIDLDSVVVTLDADPAAAILPPGMLARDELAVSASGPMTYRNLDRSLDMDGVVLSAQGLDLTVTGQGVELGRATRVTATAELAQADPRPFLAAFGADLSGSLPEEALARLELAADLAIRNGILDLTLVRCGLDETVLSGRLGLALGSDRPVHVRLHADRIDADRYLAGGPQAAPDGESSAPDPLEELERLEASLAALPMDGVLEVEQLVIGNLPLSGVRLELAPRSMARPPDPDPAMGNEQAGNTSGE